MQIEIKILPNAPRQLSNLLGGVKEGGGKKRKRGEKEKVGKEKKARGRVGRGKSFKIRS